MTSSTNSVEEKLALYLPRLGHMGAQLKEVSSQIETSVMDVCRNFHGIAGRTRDSTARTTEWLVQGSGGEDSPRSFESLIAACEATMITLINAFAASGEIAQRAVDRIQKVDDAARQISNALSRLDNISHGNKILALNARIEAAHAGEHAAGFASVAVELSSQTDKSREVSTAVGEVAEHLRSLATSTLQDLRQMQAEDHKRAQQCRADVDSTLQSLRDTHDGMRQMLGRLAEESALLGNDINEAVRGLQFQDRISQRIAHVVADLEVMQTRLLAVQAGADDSGNDDPNAGFSEHVMHEERAIYGVVGEWSAAGDVELF